MPTQTINDLKAANPYRNQAYKKSGWQNFLSALGFRTQADAWQENMSVQAAEYDAALAQKQFDSQYNSPQEQVARMEAAGLNPNLDPSSIDSGSAAPMGEDPSTPMQSTGDEGSILGVVQTAANMIMSGFTSGLGLVSSLQGIQSNHLQNVLGSIQNEDAFSKFVNDNWMSFLPTFPDDELMFNEFDWKAQAQKNAEVFSGTLPKRLRKKFNEQVSRYWENGPANSDAYKAWYNEVNARKGYYQSSQEFHSQLDSVLKDISQPLAEMAEKIYSQSQKTDMAQLKEGESEAKNDKEYYDALDASQQAATENATNELGETNAHIVSTLNGALDDITSNLKATAQKGGIEGSLAQIALVGIAGVRLWLSNIGLPSISRSSGSSESIGKNSSSGSSRSSFSIGW